MSLVVFALTLLVASCFQAGVRVSGSCCLAGVTPAVDKKEDITVAVVNSRKAYQGLSLVACSGSFFEEAGVVN